MIGGFSITAISKGSEGDMWWYDFHYDSNFFWAQQECNDAANFLNGHWYNGQQIAAFVYRNEWREFITQHSLGLAKVFHMASHGGEYYSWPCIINYLETHWGEWITPWYIPDLSNVHGGGNELLGFGSACRSGTYHWWCARLSGSFIGRGSIAYMGYQYDVLDQDAYNFAHHFYDYISHHHTIDESIDYAHIQTNYAVFGNLQRYGDGNIYMVDD